MSKLTLEKLGGRLKGSRIPDEVDDTLHRKLMSAVAREKSQSTSFVFRPAMAWAGSAVALAVAVLLLVQFSLNPEVATEDSIAATSGLDGTELARADMGATELGTLMSRLDLAQALPAPEAFLRQELSALESDLEKFMPRRVAATRATEG